VYSSFLFLLLVFLIPNTAPEPITSIPLIFTLLTAISTLLLIAFQNRIIKLPKNQMHFLANGELITCLVLIFFTFGPQRLLEQFHFYEFTVTLFSVLFYFTGIALFHYTSTHLHRKAAYHYAINHILFLLPFALPFLLFLFLMDLLATFNPLLMIVVALFFMSAVTIFFPALIQRIWQCTPLSDLDPLLAERLELCCQKAKFRHAGLKIWTLMNDSITAAIMGIIPRFRYIMFTKRLLGALSPDSIEAVLVHEMGHAYHRHLLFYPFIMLGMVACLSLVVVVFEPVLPSIIFFILYAGTIWIYFRLVFGFFSRHFERQADVYVCKLDIPAQHMINALHEVAVASGNTHRVPSWHHYSIQERIDFLKQAEHNPEVTVEHDRFVKKCLWIYLLFFIPLFILIFLIPA